MDIYEVIQVEVEIIDSGQKHLTTFLNELGKKVLLLLKCWLYLEGNKV